MYREQFLANSSCIPAFLDTAKHASGVYESFKDEDEHKKIIDLCDKNPVANTHVKMALGCLLGSPCDDIGKGLKDLLELEFGPPKWDHLSAEAKAWLKCTSKIHPELVKRAGSSISTIKTDNAAKFISLDLESDVSGHGISCLEAAFLVVLKASHSEAIKSGLGDDDFKKIAKMIFCSEHTFYESALNKILADELELVLVPAGETQTLKQKVIEAIFTAVDSALAKAVAKANRIDPNAELAFEAENTAEWKAPEEQEELELNQQTTRSAPVDQASFKSARDHMYGIATVAFSLFCLPGGPEGGDRNFSREQMQSLTSSVFNPQRRGY
jgi:hypothetical protein